MRRLLLVCAALAVTQSAWAAKIELSTVPPREGVEVIIYRDVDLTLVREQRTIRFHEGSNEIAFSWADTNIDPTSVRIQIAGDGAGYALTETTYPPEQPNTLVWHITAPQDGPAALEVSYFTSGLTWSASYNLILNYEETEGSFAADFSIGNESGEEYESAKVSLLTGGVQLVEQVVALGEEAEYARRPKTAMAMDMPSEAAPPAPGGFGGGGYGGAAGGRLGIDPNTIGFADEVSIAAGSASEHERYDLDTELALRDGWVTRLRFADADAAKPKVLARTAGLVGASSFQRVVQITNDEDHGLGQAPLPAGPVTIFKRTEAGRLVFLGQSQVPYAAVGQEVEFGAGVLPDLVIEAKITDQIKRDFDFAADGRMRGKVLESGFSVEVRNRDHISRTLELTQFRPGIANQVVGLDATAELEAGLIKWELPLAAGETFDAVFRIEEYHGTAINQMPKEGE